MHAPTSTESPLLTVRNLRTSFQTDAGEVCVVDDVSLSIPRGATVAIVGESGCGKSVTALSIMRLIATPPGRIRSGEVRWHMPTGEPPVDLLQLNERHMRRMRGRHIAMVFQEPMTSLNPVLSIGEQIIETVELHHPERGQAAAQAAADILGSVGIANAAGRMHDYPHQFSGGMRQRVLLAMALSCQPDLLIADEPTTALDVTVQAQILNLLAEWRITTGMSLLLISHDMSVVARLADYIYVMYAGRIVEHAEAGQLLADPLHPYTQALLRCVPRLSSVRGQLAVIRGTVPDPSSPPTGCRFHPRCELTVERATTCPDMRTPLAPKSTAGASVLRRCCVTSDAEPSGNPPLRELRPGRFVACWEVDSPACCQPAQWA